jgi:hypothetical protein
LTDQAAEGDKFVSLTGQLGVIRKKLVELKLLLRGQLPIE